MTTTRARVRIEDGQKRIRAYVGGELIADSANVKLVWEKPYYPVYYFAETDVRMDLLAPSSTGRSPSRGDIEYLTIKADGTEAADGAYRHPDSPVEELRGLVAFRWSAIDNWFEEDEEVFVHARDPYTRVDILPSSRHVRVEVAGVTVAESTNARFLFETGLPTRYYLPKPNVRMDLLTATDTVTHCPYKGSAEYWALTVDGEVFPDIVWGYRSPVEESQRIAGYVSFYNEHVDTYIDGELEARPKTMFT